MQTARLLQLIESFVSDHTPVFREPVHVPRAFSASESLLLPSPTVFRHDINMAGYVLRICGDAVFDAGIANAVVLALGPVVIREGCRNCTVFSTDSIHVGNAESSLFVCYGDLSIGAESSRSSTTATGSIVGPKASICGGTLSAGDTIVVQNAVAPPDTATAFRVGDRGIYLSALRILTAYIDTLTHALGDTDRRIRRIGTDSERPADNPLLPALQQQQQGLGRELARVRTELDALRSRTTRSSAQNTITVLSYVGDNLSIDICGRRFITSDAMQSVEFKADGDRVVTAPARHPEDSVTYFEL